MGGTKLVLFGGGKFPEAGVKRFVAYAGGEKSRILVIPWASERSPTEVLNDMKADMTMFPELTYELAPPAKEMGTRRDEFLKQLDAAGGVFFSGGDQVRITEVLKDKVVYDAIHQRYNKGKAFAGTSAGTAVMSQTMITGNGNFEVIAQGAAETASGLGFVNSIVLDQHFIKRQRLNRLMSVLLTSTERCGLGVDEKAAVSLENGRQAEVLGTDSVILACRSGETDRFDIRVKRPGATFRFPAKAQGQFQ
jgi:cyanophycinase